MNPLLLQIVLPAFLGVLFCFLFRKKIAFSGAGNGQFFVPAAFLLSQISLIYYFGFASLEALSFVIIVIFSYAFFVAKNQKSDSVGLSRFALAFFVLYLLYWLFTKYVLVFIARHAALALGAPPDMNGAEVTLLLPQASIVGSSLLMVGISFIGFKLIHFEVDRRNGDIGPFNPIEVVSWLMFFPSIIAGPMMRFQDWQEQRAAHRLELDDLIEGGRRVMMGLVMKYAFADSIYAATLPKMSIAALSSAPMADLAIAAALYTVYMYCDFSGYSHMAIGVARFWGIRLPENFRFPFLSRNLAEYWNRWHITLSEILRDYLFYPISLYLKRKPSLKHVPLVAVAVPPIATFLVAGVWHGLAVGFVLYGLWHGIGLAALAIAKRRKPRTAFGRYWEKSLPGHVVGTGFTFVYVTIGLVFFSLSGDRLLIIWQRLL